MNSKIDASDFLNVAEIVARKFHFGKDAIKDTELYSICCLRVVELASKYDGAKADFFNLAYTSCRNAIIDHLRKGKRKKNDASFQELDNLEWQDLKSEANLFSDEIKKEILDFVSNSDDPDMKLILDVYFNHKKISEIARLTNKSKQTVHVKLRNALAKLSSLFKNNDEHSIERFAS